MSCISTSRIAILVNESKTEFFYPTRDIKQGDPMSPYFFILCMELLSKYIFHHVNIVLQDPIQLNYTGPLLSHLFYADDLTLALNANVKYVQSIKHCLTFFSQLSGQKINTNKSKITFSKNCDPSTRNHLANILNIKNK